MIRGARILLAGAVLIAPAVVHAEIAIRRVGQSRIEIAGAGAVELLVLSRDPETGDLRHNRFAAGDSGYESEFDFDDRRAGEQRVTPGADLLFRFRSMADDILVIDESLVATPTTYTFRPQLITGPFGGAILTVLGPLSITVVGSPNGDRYELDPADDLAVTIQGGSGDDTVVVGALNHNYSALKSLITLAGGDGADTLILDDTAQLQPSASYEIRQSQISMINFQIPNAQMDVDLDEFERVSLLMGESSNNVQVISTPSSAAGTTMEVVGGAGNNFLQIFEDATRGRLLEDIASAIVFDGRDTNSFVSISRSGSDDAVRLTIRDDLVSADPNDTFFGPGGSLRVVSKTDVSIDFGEGPRDVTIAPSQRVRYSLGGGFAINGGQTPSVSSTLRVEIPEGEEFSLRESSFSGLSYVFDNHESIQFFGFDRLTPGGSVRGRVFADADGDGVQDEPGEAGLAGIPVELDLVGDSLAPLRTTTDAQGTYIFSDLAPQTYLVRVLVSDGAIATPSDRADAAVSGIFSPAVANFGLKLSQPAPAQAAPITDIPIGQNAPVAQTDDDAAKAADAAAAQLAAEDKNDEASAAVAPGGLCPGASLALMVVGVVGVISTRKTQRR